MTCRPGTLTPLPVASTVTDSLAVNITEPLISPVAI